MSDNSAIRALANELRRYNDAEEAQRAADRAEDEKRAKEAKSYFRDLAKQGEAMAVSDKEAWVVRLAERLFERGIAVPERALALAESFVDLTEKRKRRPKGKKK